jgi:hypothetical protein
MSGLYTYILDRTLRAWIYVEFTTDRRTVTDYAVLLFVQDASGRIETVRVYDGAHGQNELHRYTRQGGKQAAEIFNRDNLGAGMRAAIEEVKHSYRAMIDSWHRQ